MEQHPIPQNISSYEFRLVGDMTLKQFLQLAGSILVGVVIYRLPLPAFVRYPFVFLAVVIGIALAFVPINGRPFARYIFAFITAIYSPTEFVWRQEAKTLSPIPLPPAPVTVPIPEPHPVADVAPLITTNPNDVVADLATQTSTTTITPPPVVQNPLPPVLVSNPDQLPSTPLPGSDSDQTIFSATQTHVDTPEESVVIDLPKKSSINEGVLANITHLITSPTQANILAGIVMSPDGNTQENAIVEIIDSKTGIPARALRTNRTGQFQIATPLSQGSYTIQTEKEGATFSPVHITVNNTIIDPIIITSV